jgi:hypothetical protein
MGSRGSATLIATFSVALAPALAHAQAADGSSEGSATPHAALAKRAPVGRAAATSHRAAHAASPDVIQPGFETLADGSTRLFVELSRPVTYETKTARGELVYVLKGAHVNRRNNFNPLVTVHFNTPVTRARLVPKGRDLWFVVSVRADVQPAVSMDSTTEGGAVLHISFPKGDYVPPALSGPGPAPIPDTLSPAEPSDEPAEAEPPAPRKAPSAQPPGR